jgi:hypothetical protein
MQQQHASDPSLCLLLRLVPSYIVPLCPSARVPECPSALGP